jgi:type II secretory pathway component PulL
MDTERKIYGLLETVEQQQKSLQIAAEALDQTRHAIALLVEEVQEAAAAGASAGAAQALEQAGLLIAEAAKPTINELKQMTASAAQVQYQFQKVAAWATWKHFALVAGGCLVLLLGVWIAVAAQRAELTELKDQKAALEAQIAPLQSAVDELVQKGGRIKFNVCGNDRRKCAKVNVGMGTFAKAGENYMILDGY